MQKDVMQKLLASLLKSRLKMRFVKSPFVFTQSIKVKRNALDPQLHFEEDELNRKARAIRCGKLTV